MKTKRILSLCVIAAIISSCFNWVFAEDELPNICIGKEIRSVYYDDGGISYPVNNDSPSKMIDGNTNTYFTSGAGINDGFIINLKGAYKIASAKISFNGGAPDCSISVSKTSDFSADVYELTKDGNSFLASEEIEDESFSYVKVNILSNRVPFRIREIRVYGTEATEQPEQPPEQPEQPPEQPEQPPEQPEQPPEQPEQPPAEISGSKTLPAFENKKVPVSLNKKAVAKMYNDGGYYSSYAQMTHHTGLAVDGVIDPENNNAFISAYTDEDWLRVDLGEKVKISDIEITGYSQYRGVRVDNVPDWFVVMASNNECAYDEAFTEYVVLEGGFTDMTGTFTLPEECKDQKFRYFQIVKPKKEGILDAMIIREFTVNAYEKDLTHIASQKKPVIRNGVINYNDALTDGDASTKANYENAVIDLLTPSYIKDIVATGDNTSGITYYGGVENADVSAMKLISDYPDEKYRYIYIDNSVGANISEIEISTYSSDILSVWNYDEEENIYSLNVINGDATASRNYTAIVSQIDADGKVLTTTSQELTLSAESEGKFEISPEFAFGVDRVVCNVFREDIIALTNPTVFIAGENKTQAITSDGVVAADKTLTDIVEKENVNNGLKIKAKTAANIEGTDVYSVIIRDPSGEIIGYMSENAKNTDAVYEYVASTTDPEGTYKAIISLTDPNLKTYYKEYSFNNVYPTAEELANCIAEFKATDGSNLADLYDRFYTQKRVLDFSELSFIDNQNVFNRIGPAYAWARDNVSKWSTKSSVETTDDILSCFKAALILDAAIHSDISLTDAAKLYSGDMNKIFIEDCSTVAELYARKYTDTDYETVLANFVMCNALASIKDRSATDIAENLKTYGTDLKLDIDKIIADGVDLYQIAKRIDTTIPDSYYDGLSAEVDAIIANIPKDEQHEEVSGSKTLPAFENEKVPVSLNKKAVSKLYNEGGFYSSYLGMTHSTDLAVDGKVNGEEVKNEDINQYAFLSFGEEEEWLRVDLGKEVRIEDLVITAYPQKSGVEVVDVPEWYTVMASNNECAYDEAFREYVVLEGDFTNITGVFRLPDEYKDQKFRYFQIVKHKHSGKIDAMLVREFTVNAYEKDLTLNSSLNKPVIRDGVIYYNDPLTDGDASTKASYENAVIDLLTPSYIKDIVATGDNTSGVAYYGGVENADVSAMKLISDYPDEKYRYIYIDNSVGANISEIEISTYFSDVLSVWNYDKEKNIYSLNVTNGDSRTGITDENGDSKSDRIYTAIVSQIDADGKVLKTDSQTITLSAESEGKFEISPEFAFGVDHVVCNVFREDTIALTNPTVFVAGENKTQAIMSDGVVAADKTLTDIVEGRKVNNGLKLKAGTAANIEGTDVYSVIIYNPSGEIIGYMSENAKNTEAVYEYVASTTDPEGTYKVIISLTDPNLKTCYEEYSFNNVYPTAEELANCIADFKATDGSNFADLYDRFYTQKRVLDFSELSFIDNQNVFNRIGPAYAWARDNVSKWSTKGSVETTDDILSCFKVALVFDAAMYSDISLTDAAKLYSGDMNKIFIEDCSTVAELYGRKYTDTDYETVLANFVMCNALASIKDRSVTDIVKNLKTYGTDLKLDINKIIADRVDLYEIAKRIDKTIPDSYYDGLKVEVGAIIADIPKYEKPAQGGSSPGGGGGGGNKVPVSVFPPVGEATEQQGEVAVKNKEFKDVPETHWAKDNIARLTKEGVLNGTSENTFEPERQITRAEFIKVVVSAFKITTNPGSKLTFGDCDVNDWYYPYIDAGVTNKIISGVSAEEFCPNKSIMRQDAAVILDNVLLYLKYALPEPKDASFTDAHEISPYASQAVKLLVECKIINGMDDGSFNPRGALTRAQAATLIVNILDFIGGEVGQ